MRIIVFFILSSSVILFQNFAASYTSFLSVVKPYKPFADIEDLYKDTDIIIGTRKGVAMFDLFKVNKIRKNAYDAI